MNKLEEEIEYIICSSINGDIDNCNRDWCNDNCSFRLPRLKGIPNQILSKIREAVEEVRLTNSEKIQLLFDDGKFRAPNIIA